MRSKTSLFSWTVFKNNMTRFWPIWALYLLIMILCLPVTFMSAFKAGLYENIGSVLFSANLVQWATTSGSIVFASIYVAISAMAIYSYLYTSKSAGMIGSFPITRRGMFITGYISGLVWIVVPNIIIALVIMIAELMMGKFMGIYILYWLLIFSGEEIFLFSVASFCAVLTGNVVALPIIFFAVNFIVAGFESAVKAVSVFFVFGLGNIDLSKFATLFTPMVEFSEASVNVYDSLGNEVSLRTVDGSLLNGCYIAYDSTWYLIGALIVGFLMVAAAVTMIKYRRMESASDTISVSWMKPVFKYAVEFASALVLGMLLYQIVFGYSKDAVAPKMIGCMAVTSMIGGFAAEMILERTTKVFSKWKGIVAATAVIVVLGLTLEFDVFGIERRVPEIENVNSATISVMGEKMTAETPEEIAQVIDIQKMIIDNKTEIEKARSSNVGDDTYFVTVAISYFDENDEYIFRRYYNIPISEKLINTEGSFQQKVQQFFTSDKAIAERYGLDGINIEQVYAANVFVYDEVSGTSEGKDLTPDEFEYFYNECIMKDVNENDAGNIKLYNIGGGGGTFTVEINLYLSRISESGTTEYYDANFVLRLADTAKNTIEYIEQMETNMNEYSMAVG